MKHAMPLARGEQPMNTRTNVPRKLRGKPFQAGFDSRRNLATGGRHSDEFKARMRLLAGSDDVLKAIAAILNDKDHPHFVRALTFAADRGYGRPTQPIDVTSTGRTLADVLNEGRDRVARLSPARSPDAPTPCLPSHPPQETPR